MADPGVIVVKVSSPEASYRRAYAGAADVGACVEAALIDFRGLFPDVAYAHCEIDVGASAGPRPPATFGAA